jgi:ATP-dependent helicase/nuclease subunit A
MGRRFDPLNELQGDQAQAVDPGIHASVSASAGSGKTQVLTGRVLRLLLDDVAPETILCLTFTKGGAAEMANRVGRQLAAWVRMKDADLRKDLIAIGERNDPATLLKARRLFAKVLEASGGMRIQTIHSFAQTLLASFPAEAGIAPGFQPIEGRAEQELARTTLANLLADAEAAGDQQLLDDVRCLSLRIGEDGATQYLMRCAAAPDALAAFGGGSDVEDILRQAMALPAGDPRDLVLGRCRDDAFDCDLLRRLLEANRQWPTESGRSICANIEAWLSATPEARASSLGKLADRLVTRDFRPYKISPRQIAACGDYEELVQKLATLLRDIDQLDRGVRLASDMAAGIRAGQAFAGAYERAKRSAGVADFNDLIRWTRKLLAKPGISEWVRYKLDRRTDHILVDESQDTNRDQWEIVEALADEFFRGISAADRRNRTMFLVGDFKQAIFRFQGTDPREFEKARDWVRENAGLLREAAEQAEEPWTPPAFKDLSIHASFRAAPAILEAVDATIREVGHRAMGLGDDPARHLAFFKDRPGTVELWTPFSADPSADLEDGEEGWFSEDERRYAAALAGQVRKWIDEAPILASTRRPLGPGDILILVRSRTKDIAALIVARLFEAGVRVAGVDRLQLHKPLAVQDLLAAVRFAVQPLDDLNLANLLVSPLIGWTQELLFELAFDRKLPLWPTLRERADEREQFAEARTLCGELLAMADFTTAHRFLETILSGPMEGRRKLYARLGLAARDPIDELMNSALEFERDEIGSLERFLAWFSRGEVEIKRESSAAGGAVRVMTVHGAKGLEAPVVILADATADPAKQGGVSRTIDFPVPGAGKAPLLRPRKAERIAPFDTLIAEDERLDLEEHWRLLYVGMTRAMERLIVAGIDKGNRVENSWHVRVERALTALGAERLEHAEWPQPLVYRGALAPAPVRPKPPPRALDLPVLPDWARSPAPPEARPPRPLAPSSIASDDEAAPPPPSEAMRAAARRGTLIHQLLERLVDVAAGERRAAALRWLERSAGVADEAQRDEIAGQVCGILADPRFSALFGPGSLGEAPLAATLPDGRVIAGTIDRLLVEPERVSVIDFKTGRVPASENAIPPSHRKQMQAYADALRVIFPGRDVRSALLYTAGPSLFELAP